MTGAKSRLLTLGFFSALILDLSGGSSPPAPSTAYAESAAGPATYKSASVLPFIEDDFAAAHEKAVQSQKLLVVDAWAPWCHTCLSMKNFVFTDPTLRPLADKFVFLAVDTELPANQDFVARFPIRSWPTLLVIEPAVAAAKPSAASADKSGAAASDRIVARLTGGMTASALLASLQETLDARSVAQPLLSRADAAAAAGQAAAAEELYAQAAATPAWRGRALLGQVQALREMGWKTKCAELGETTLRQLMQTAAAAAANIKPDDKSALYTDLAAYTADCLDSYPDVDTRQRLRKSVLLSLEALVTDPQAALATDDRSDGYGTLIELADGLGDKPLGDRFARTRLQLLETAAQAASSPQIAATFDAHRFDCYRRLHLYKEAEQMLLGSARVLPSDYNPPARLARLYFEMGRLDSALTLITSAIAKASGPRRIGMYELRSSIQHGLGQTADAITSLQAAMTLVQSQPRPFGAPPPAKLQSLQSLVTKLQAVLPEPPPAGETTKPARAKPAPPPPPPTVVPMRPGEPVATKQRGIRNVARRDPSPK